jgi:arylamine N-acetyltransferase
VIPPTDRDAYLARLGVDAEPPSVDGLIRLHRAHVERVAYETLWIHLGERWGIGVDESMARVATRRRGGYCYHLNGAFGGLLRALGYDVTRHVGGVHGPDGPAEASMTNHLVLTVHGLPTDDWNLTHDPAGGFAGMSWRSAPVGMDAFAQRHAWLSTSPESGFVRVLTAQRRDASGVDILRGLTLRRIGDRASESTLTTRAELAGVLGDLFGLDVSPVSDRAWDALWAAVHASHVAWESTRGT